MLHYIIKGAKSTKPTLVLLHGFLESHSMWSYLALDHDRETVVIDLPGHGNSSSDHIASMKEMALAVRAVLDHEKIASYTVIGHSMGGYVGLELCHSDSRCSMLVLLNSNFWADTKAKKEDRKRVAELVKTKKDRFISEAIPNLFEKPEAYLEDVKALIHDSKQMSAAAIGAASIAMSERKDYTQEVQNGTLNVYVIQGIQDRIAPVKLVQTLMENRSEYLHLVDSGHMAHIEATDAVVKILREIGV